MRGDEGLDDVDGAHEVDLDDLPPLLRRHGARISPDRDAGDVVDLVGHAVFGGDTLRPVLDGGPVGDVEAGGVEDLGAGQARVGDGALQAVGRDVGKHQRHAVAGEAEREFAADAGGRAGDECGVGRRGSHGRGLGHGGAPVGSDPVGLSPSLYVSGRCARGAFAGPIAA